MSVVIYLIAIKFVVAVVVVVVLIHSRFTPVLSIRTVLSKLLLSNHFLL